MDKPTTTPRRPLVPGPGYPSQSGIAAKAVALREEKAQAAPAVRENTDSPPLARLREPARPQLPVTTVGKLATGIAGVMAEVGTIEKGGRNTHYGYSYARMEDLLHAVTPLMGKHGIVVIQNEVERGVIENRITVTYEFSIIHASGECWPERPRFTGMCIGRNSKGDWDDKAINKCHTAARKYFLLSLFQVPAGDFDEADASTQDQRANNPQQPKTVERPRTVPGPSAPPPSGPHKIVGTGTDASAWAQAYLKAIEKAADLKEMAQWESLNDGALQKLSDNFPDVYEHLTAAVGRRADQLSSVANDTTVANLMPDPKKDAQEAMNWIAQSLQDLNSYAAAEAFWNEVVAPREPEFDVTDWDMLMNEWRRTELRLNPADEDEPDASGP